MSASNSKVLAKTSFSEPQQGSAELGVGAPKNGKLNTCSISGVSVAASAQHAEVRKCLANAAKRLRAITSASEKSGSAVELAVRAYLSSRAVRVSGAYNYYRHRFPNRPVNLRHVLSVASSFKWNAPIAESVTLFTMPKGSGGRRLICDFGPIWRSAAYGLRPLLELRLNASKHPFQYFFLGYKKAIARARHLLAAGPRFICNLDIQNCYPSVNVSQLGKLLSLPQGVVDNVCALKDAHVVWKGDQHDPKGFLTEKIRWSLPQGLPIAPLIAAIIISTLAWKSIPGVVLINFADNFLLVGKSKKAVTKAADALRAEVKALAGGSFCLKPAEVVSSEEGFEFLGHDFQWLADGLLLRPSSSAEDECARVFQSYERELNSLYSPKKLPLVPKKQALKIAGRMKTYLLSWCAAFDECHGINQQRAALESAMQHCLAPLGIAMDQLGRFYDASAEFSWHGYSDTW
jgi:hypothetical protein